MESSNDSVAVAVYTTRVCPYCHAAKALLARVGIPFKEIDVTESHERREWLAQVTGRRTVPQIFIGSESIGGYDELSALDRAGVLASRVKSAS